MMKNNIVIGIGSLDHDKTNSVSFQNVVLDLGIKRKELNAQLFDLGQTIGQYQNIIGNKKTN